MHIPLLTQPWAGTLLCGLCIKCHVCIFKWRRDRGIFLLPNILSVSPLLKKCNTIFEDHSLKTSAESDALKISPGSQNAVVYNHLAHFY